MKTLKGKPDSQEIWKDETRMDTVLVLTISNVLFIIFSGLIFYRLRHIAYTFSIYRTIVRNDMNAVKMYIQKNSFGAELGEPVYTNNDEVALKIISKYIYNETACAD